MMKFEKHVNREAREYLIRQLKEYELVTQMSKKERRLLHEWVSSGRSPYENEDNICSAGIPLDFISALRIMPEIMDNLEKIPMRCDTFSDEIVWDISELNLSSATDDDLPFSS